MMVELPHATKRTWKRLRITPQPPKGGVPKAPLPGGAGGGLKQARITNPRQRRK